MKRIMFMMLSLLTIFSLLLSGCGQIEDYIPEDIEVPDTLMPELWDELLEEATIPASFFWIMVAFCTAMAGGLMAYGGVTKLRGETVSFASADSFALFIQALVSGLILVIWIVATGGTVVPAWIMAPYVVIELAAILLVRRGVA